METIKFLVFFAVSYFILMQIFNWSTYHKYFWKVLPVLVLYSALAGYLLFYFSLHRGFLWQIFLSIVFFISNSRKQDRQAAQVQNILEDPTKTDQMNLSEDLDVFSVTNSLDNMDHILTEAGKASLALEQKKDLLMTSYRKTKKFFWLSAVTYLIVFSVTYTYLYAHISYY